jgi:adenine phosphoribosyltransferase
LQCLEACRDVVAAAEARGFIFAAPLALELDVGFVPVRKPGKLPFETHAFHYELEYGSDTLEMHRDGIMPGQRVLLVDDLLATGGTMAAAVTLLEQVGAVVPATACIIELTFLEGRKRLKPPVEALLSYDS